MALVDLGTKIQPKAIQETPSSVLPGKDQVEKLISAREPLSGVNIRKGLMKPGILPKLGAGMQAVGLPFQRAESGLAAPLLKLQDPDFLERTGMTTGESISGFPGVDTPRKSASEFTEDVKRVASEQSSPETLKKVFGGLKELGQESLSGFKGEKVVEFGDVPRSAGFPEPVSKFIGLGTAVALVDPAMGNVIKTIGANLGSAGRALVGARKSGEVLKPGAYTKVHKELTKVVDDADDLRKIRGAELANKIKGETVKISQKATDSVLNSIPKKFRKKVFSDDIIDALEMKVIRNQSGDVIRVPADPENVWKFKRAIQDSMTSKAFKETVTDLVGSKLKHSLSEARKLMDNFSEGTRKSLDDFGELVTNMDKVKRLLKSSTGVVKEKGLRGLEKVGAEEGVREAFRILSSDKFLPQLGKVITDSANISTRQAIKKTAKRVGGAGLGLEALRRVFKKNKGGEIEIMGDAN